MNSEGEATGSAVEDEAARTDDAAGQPSAQAPGIPAQGESCPARPITHTQAIVDNLPYAAMLLLGAAIFPAGIGGGLWRWVFAGLYLACGLGGALWVMLFICPYCHFYDTRICPCGYGHVAPRLRSRKNADRFARQFKKHIPVIVPLWVVPAAAGGIFLFRGFSVGLLVLLGAFVVNSFVILPLVSKGYGCKHCSQKEQCPWMAKVRQGS